MTSMTRLSADETLSDAPPFMFEGIDSPNSTSFPDVLLDRVMAHISGAEFKVLAYIVRRTFGFKKNADTISLDQICHGITRRDGSILDEGTGLTRKTAIAALKGLEDKGIITVLRRSSPTRGNLPSSFALRFRTAPPQEDDPRQASTAEDHDDADGWVSRDTSSLTTTPVRARAATPPVGVQKSNQGGEDGILPPEQNSDPRSVITPQGRVKNHHPQQTVKQQTETTTAVVVDQTAVDNFTASLPVRPAGAFTADQARVLTVLLQEGVAPTRALELCVRFPAAAIERQVRWLDGRRYDDRAACLVAAIEHDYSAPVSSAPRRDAGARRGPRSRPAVMAPGPNRYSRGAYGVCPDCGCSPCDPQCPHPR